MNIQKIEPQAGADGYGVRVQSMGNATADRIVPPIDTHGNRLSTVVVERDRAVHWGRREMKKLRYDSHRVAQGYSVEFTFYRGEFLCEWSPHCPSRNELRRILASDLYTQARDQFSAEIARSLGLKFVVIVEEP
jgi:hypothetical protein